MARNDGIDRTMARNRDLIADDIESTQAHNEREKEKYSSRTGTAEKAARNHIGQIIVLTRKSHKKSVGSVPNDQRIIGTLPSGKHTHFPGSRAEEKSQN